MVSEGKDIHKTQEYISIIKGQNWRLHEYKSACSPKEQQTNYVGTKQ